MKLSIIAIFFSFSMSSLIAQNNNLKILKDELTVYEGVITKEGLSKSVLFTEINKWIAIYFVSANDVIQFSDKESGELIAKGVHSYTQGVAPYKLKYTLSITVKDGRFKFNITITSWLVGTVYTPSLHRLIDKPNAKYSIKCFAIIKSIRENIVNELVKIGGASEDEDW